MILAKLAAAPCLAIVLVLSGCAPDTSQRLAGVVDVSAQNVAVMFPARGATEVNPDAHFTLTFDAPPVIGSSGKIRILDAADHFLVDELDMSIPVSPNPTGRAAGADGSTTAPRPPAPAGPDNHGFQYDLIGGTYFHFFPIIVRGNTATIYPHQGKLEYGRRYIIKIEPGVLERADGTDVVFSDRGKWTFTTKAKGPGADVRLVVAADGSGDFNTVQGAVDHFPAKNPVPVEIVLKEGHYEEIVNIQGKSGITIRGEDREKTVVGYANNSAFNRVRPAFIVNDSSDIQLSNFTINNYFIGQARGAADERRAQHCRSHDSERLGGCIHHRGHDLHG